MKLKDAYIGQKVECGRPYGREYNEGIIKALFADGEALVEWQSEVKTPEPLADDQDVRELRAGWSGRFHGRPYPHDRWWERR